jgi:ferric enterobactin receptor
MKKLLQTFLFFTVFNHSQAQITGTLLDSLTAKPIAFATISLASDEKTLKGGLSNEGGGFVFSEIPSGTYKIIFTAVGYKSRIQRIIFVDSLPMGSILLSPNQTALQEVTVTSTRPLIE